MKQQKKPFKGSLFFITKIREIMCILKFKKKMTSSYATDLFLLNFIYRNPLYQDAIALKPKYLEIDAP